MQSIVDGLPHGIKDKIDTFSSCQLSGCDEITISGNKDNSSDLFLIGQRRDV